MKVRLSDAELQALNHARVMGSVNEKPWLEFSWRWRGLGFGILWRYNHPQLGRFGGGWLYKLGLQVSRGAVMMFFIWFSVFIKWGKNV